MSYIAIDPYFALISVHLYLTKFNGLNKAIQGLRTFITMVKLANRTAEINYDNG